MKKLIALLLALVITVSLAACCETYTLRVAEGKYYTYGAIFTDSDGVWCYEADTISGKPSYDGQDVLVLFDINGTPDNPTDDFIRSVRAK